MGNIEHFDNPDAMSKLVRETMAVVEEARESGRQEAAGEIESLRSQLAWAVKALQAIATDPQIGGTGHPADVHARTALETLGLTPD